MFRLVLFWINLGHTTSLWVFRTMFLTLGRKWPSMTCVVGEAIYVIVDLSLFSNLPSCYFFGIDIIFSLLQYNNFMIHGNFGQINLRGSLYKCVKLNNFIYLIKKPI